MKKPLVAYLLWFFLGFFGAHRFYLGHVGVGIAQVCTIGGFTIWWLTDAFLIPSRVEQANVQARVDQLEIKP